MEKFSGKLLLILDYKVGVFFTFDIRFTFRSRIFPLEILIGLYYATCLNKLFVKRQARFCQLQSQEKLKWYGCTAVLWIKISFWKFCHLVPQDTASGNADSPTFIPLRWNWWLITAQTTERLMDILWGSSLLDCTISMLQDLRVVLLHHPQEFLTVSTQAFCLSAQVYEMQAASMGGQPEKTNTLKEVSFW